MPVPETASVELVTVEGHTYMATYTDGVLGNAVAVTNPPTRRSVSAFVRGAFQGTSRTIAVGDGKTVMREKLTPEAASWVEQARVALALAEKAAVPALIAREFSTYFPY